MIEVLSLTEGEGLTTPTSLTEGEGLTTPTARHQAAIERGQSILFMLHFFFFFYYSSLLREPIT